MTPVADARDETGALPTMPQPVLNARALKCTIVLDPAEVAQIVASDGKPRTVIAIRLPDRRVSADLNAKSVRKAVATISEHGPDGVAVIIQGKLVGDAHHRGGDRRAAEGEATDRGGGSMSKIPSLNRAEAEFFRQMDEIATGVMASLDEFADDVAGGVSPEVEQWLRRGAAMVQELTTHVLALAAVSTERERADLMRALDALQARLDAHVAAQPKWRRR